MEHVVESVADVRAGHAELKTRVDAMDRKLFMLSAIGAGLGAAVVQLVPQIAGALWAAK